MIFVSHISALVQKLPTSGFEIERRPYRQSMDDRKLWTHQCPGSITIQLSAIA
jgi:hypothetical protein